MPITSFKDFEGKKEQIRVALRDIAPNFDQLRKIGIDVNSNIILELDRKLKEEQFKVLVIGEFKNGKSTVINSLLGEKVLPAYSTPCTAVINEVKYGNEKKAMLFFKNPLPQNMTTDIKEKAKQHIKKYENSNEIPPYEIDASELEEYVTIPDPCKDQADSIRELPYSKVVLEYPIPLCKNGVEIIDSPGLNENETRTKVTEEYLKQADAILFVFRCPKIAGENGIRYIEDQLHPRGHKEIFFICNCINLVPEEERSRLIKYGNQKLSPLTDLKEKGIFYVDALGALKAKEKHDGNALKDTGMPQLEESLSEFLRNKRGKAKLLSILIPLTSYVDLLCTNQVKNYLGTLAQNMDELEKKVKDAMPHFELAIQHKKNIEEKLDVKFQKFQNDVQRQMDAKYLSIMNDIPKYVEALDTTNKISMKPWKQTESQKALLEELYSKLNEYVQDQMSQWIKIDLTKYLSSFVIELENDIGQDVDQFYKNLDDFRCNVSATEEPNEMSAFERVGATILGTLVGGPAYGVVGATMGLKETAKRSAAVSVAALLIGMTPIGMPGFVLLVVGSGLYSILTGSATLTGNFKAEVANSFVQRLKESKDNVTEEYAKKLSKNMRNGYDCVTVALQKEIDIENSKIIALREDRERGAEERKNKEQILQGVLQNLTDINSRALRLKESVE